MSLATIIDDVLTAAGTAAKARPSIIKSEPVQNLIDVLTDEVRAAFTDEVKASVAELAE